MSGDASKLILMGVAALLIEILKFCRLAASFPSALWSHYSNKILNFVCRCIQFGFHCTYVDRIADFYQWQIIQESSSLFHLRVKQKCDNYSRIIVVLNSVCRPVSLWKRRGRWPLPFLTLLDEMCHFFLINQEEYIFIKNQN